LGEGAILRLSREAGETLPTSHLLTVQIARAESHKSQIEGSHLGRPPPRTFLHPGEPPEAAERTVAVLPPQEVSHFATVRRLGAVLRRDLCSPLSPPVGGRNTRENQRGSSGV
jgi:hypothetical protein